MKGSADPLEMLTVSDENVAVEEQLSRKNDGWVISLSITSKVDEPVGIKVALPLPSEPAILETGFHPKHEPHSWEIQDDVLVFEDTVPSDEPLVILLGIVLIGDEDVSLSLTEPTIELSQVIDSAPTGDSMSDEAPIFRSSSASAPTAQEPSAKDSDAGTEPTVADSAGADDGSIFGSSPNEPSTESTTADSEVSGSSGQSIDETFDTKKLAEAAERLDEAEPVDDSDGVSGEQEGEEQSFDEFLSPLDEESIGSSGADTDPSSPDEASANDDSVDVLTALVEQLDSADPDREAVDALREHLAPESSKAIEVRLQHIQSRMDNLAAYTDALEGFINEHGTASEFMSEIQGGLAEVKTDVDDIKSETESASTARGVLKNRLDVVESSLADLDDDLHSRTENIYDDLDSIHTTLDEHDEEFAEFDESLATIDDEFESVREMIATTENDLQSKLTTIEQDVATTSDELESHRDSIDRRLSELTDELGEVRQTFQSDLRALENEVEDLAEMRDVFSQAFAKKDSDAELSTGETPNSELPVENTGHDDEYEVGSEQQE